MSSPRLSVLMSAYNASHYISEAIESVLAQTFTDFEFIIIDDASNDTTLSIMKKYAQQDNRIKLMANDRNLKLPTALNLGLGIAKAPLIARMDADDFCHPQRLEVQYAFMQKQPHLSVCGSALTVYETGQLWMPPLSDAQIRTQLLFESCIYHPTVMYRAEAVARVNGYRPCFEHAEDYDLWVRLSAEPSILFANIGQVLLRYRTHPNSNRSKEKQVDVANRIRINALAQINIFPTDQEKTIHQRISTHTVPSCLESFKSCGLWLAKLYTTEGAVSQDFNKALYQELCYRWEAAFGNQQKISLLHACTYFSSAFAKKNIRAYARVLKRILTNK